MRKAMVHAIGNRAEAQIETGGLNLVDIERPRGANPALLRQRRDHAVGQNSLLRSCEVKNHLRTTSDLVGTPLAI